MIYINFVWNNCFFKFIKTNSSWWRTKMSHCFLLSNHKKPILFILYIYEIFSFYFQGQSTIKQLFAMYLVGQFIDRAWDLTVSMILIHHFVQSPFTLSLDLIQKRIILNHWVSNFCVWYQLWYIFYLVI